MDWDDFGGAAAGGLGGLVRWHQDPRKQETVTQRVTAATTSLVCGAGFGYLAQAVIEWQWPDIPVAVAIGIAFVFGLASAVLSQAAVGLVSEGVNRVKGRYLDRLGPPPNGPAPPAGQQHEPKPAAGAGADGGPVRG